MLVGPYAISAAQQISSIYTTRGLVADASISSRQSSACKWGNGSSRPVHRVVVIS